MENTGLQAAGVAEDRCAVSKKNKFIAFNA
jgi:hypothetical protein